MQHPDHLKADDLVPRSYPNHEVRVLVIGDERIETAKLGNHFSTKQHDAEVRISEMELFRREP